MNRKSSELEAKIIEMRFQGFSRDETARILMVSGGKVSAIWALLPSCLESLRDLSKTLRKLNLLPNAALEGAKVLQLLAEHGVTPDQIPLSIEAIRRASVEAGYRPEKVIQASIKLAELENQSGNTYPEALEVLEKVTEQILERTKENSQLQLETEENRRLRDEALEQAKTTPQELCEFLDCKAALSRFGMDINDAKTVRKVLDNIKEAGGNAKRFINLIRKHYSIAKSLAYFEKQLPTKQGELANLLSKIQEYHEAISRLHAEESQLETIINWQKNAINSNNHQLNLIQGNITELEKRRQALITWIGHQLNLPQAEIEILRLNSQYDVMLAAIDNALRDAIRSLNGPR